MNIENIIKLKGKSGHGKNVVRLCGEIWERIDNGNPQCFNGEPALLIQSLILGHRRWVRVENDKDFKLC